MDDVLDAMRAGLPLVCFLLLLQACVLWLCLCTMYAMCTACALCEPCVHRMCMYLACAPHARLLPAAEGICTLHGHCMRIACLLQVAVLRRPLPQVPLPWKLSSHSANGSGGAGSSASHAAACSTVSAGWGLIALLLGLCTFEIGLKFGLVALGYQVSAQSASGTYLLAYLRAYLLGYQCGVGVPAAFSVVKAVPASPLYPPALGLALVGCYALLLGGGGTLAEPAMLVFADTVDGPAAVGRSPLRRNVLIATTAAGVAVRPSPCSPRPAALAPREGYSFEHLPPTVAASRYVRLQPRAPTVAGGVAAFASQAAATPTISRAAPAARRRRGRAEHAGAPS